MANGGIRSPLSSLDFEPLTEVVDVLLASPAYLGTICATRGANPILRARYNYQASLSEGKALLSNLGDPLPMP
jgi:hypothetical protein